jgi:hypothetical protein
LVANVLRKSCSVQSVIPLELSNCRLLLLQPLKHELVFPRAGKMNLLWNSVGGDNSDCASAPSGKAYVLRFFVSWLGRTHKLLMTMALHIASDHGSVEHIEGGKQRCGAVALVVVSHRSSTSLLQRKTRLSAIEGLNLAFLIERQDNSVRGRIDIEADHIAQLIDELRIVRKFELANPMGLEPMRQQPMALHARHSLIPWASTR